MVPRAVVGGTLSIHNLGQARVVAAEWDLTPPTSRARCMDALRELNPTLEGLIDMQGTDIEVRDGVRYAKLSKLGHGTAIPHLPGRRGEPGAELPVLEVVADGYWLRPGSIYADGLSQLGYASELLPLGAVRRMFEEGRLTLRCRRGRG